MTIPMCGNCGVNPTSHTVENENGTWTDICEQCFGNRHEEQYGHPIEHPVEAQDGEQNSSEASENAAADERLEITS